MAALPSTQSLRVFSAVAKHKTLTAAAQSLNMTHSAASQQISGLESLVDARLFYRTPAGLELTEQGSRFLAEVDAILGQLTGAMAALQTGNQALRIAAAPSFASRWLLPRLAAFSAQVPEVQVTVDSDKRAVDLAREGYHLAIRYATPDSRLATKYPLAGEWLSPLASPALLASLDPARPVRLLCDDYDTWSSWSKDANPLLGWRCETGPIVSDAAMLLEMAEAGEGVVLGRWHLCANALTQGRLKALAEEWVPARGSYYLALAPDSADHPPAVKFVRWIRKTMQETGEPSTVRTGG